MVGNARPGVLDHIVSAAHALKGLRSRSWDAFRIIPREQVAAAG